MVCLMCGWLWIVFSVFFMVVGLFSLCIFIDVIFVIGM